MPTVTFDFRARGADAVRRQMQQVLDGAGRGNAGPARQAQQEQQTTRATLREIAIRQRAAERAAAATARAEARAGAASARETTKRQNAETAASVKRSREVMRWAESVERAEQRATRATERGAARRAAAETRAATARRADLSRRGGQAAQQAFGAASQYAGTMHGQIQGARRSRADTEHTLNSALYQAGVTGTEAAGMRRTVLSAVETGNLRGLSADEVASAISATQTQFSSLTSGTQGLDPRQAVLRRQQNLNDMLGAAEFARNTYQAPGEVMRVAGMLSSQGVTGENQQSALRAMTGIAQAGSIELGNVTREALGPLMQNIAVATARLGSGATADQRSAAVRDATIQTLAVGEVGAGAGLSSRDSMNAYAKLQRAMQSDVVTGRMFEALGARRGGSAIASELFTTERDNRGQTVHRMRAGIDSLQAMGRLQEFTGGSTQLANFLQGGGGEHMVLDSQTRRLLGGLSSQTAGGQSMAQRVAALAAQGRNFGTADVARGASMIGGEQRTELTANEEQRNAALTMRNAATDFSDAVARFAAQNPYLAGAAGAAGGMGGGLSSMLGSVASSAFQSTRAFGALTSSVTAAGSGLGTLGATAGALFAGLAAGDAASRQMQAAENASRVNAPSNGVGRGGGQQDSRIDSVFSMETWQEVGRMIAGGFNANARPSPQLADHATTLGRTLLAAERNRL